MCMCVKSFVFRSLCSIVYCARVQHKPSAVCLCDNIGLVSLILLGWELRVSYITVLCVQGIPILSPLLLCHPYIPHSINEN